MKHINVILTMDLESDQLIPGWYLMVTIDNNHLMEPMPLPQETVYTLMQDITRSMQDSPHELPNFQLAQIALAGNKEILEAVRHELEFAEQQASKIASLRKQLTYLESTTSTTSDTMESNGPR